jgi:hypothetical protein
MKRLGALEGYECGVIYRLECWLEALGLSYEVSPRSVRCRMLEQETCAGEFIIRFPPNGVHKQEAQSDGWNPAGLRRKGLKPGEALPTGTSECPQVAIDREHLQSFNSLTHCLRRLPRLESKYPVRLDTAYKGPVYYDTPLTLKSAPDGGGARFDLYCAGDPRPCLMGKIDAGEHLTDLVHFSWNHHSPSSWAFQTRAASHTPLDLDRHEPARTLCMQWKRAILIYKCIEVQDRPPTNHRCRAWPDIRLCIRHHNT